jgi:VIT1/CCC1 family predicted Fe2+/Mn2+ transporter
MRHPVKIGFSFGLTSGIITTLGLMVGLHAGTNSKLAVIGGILTIAIADAFSDSLGIHVSEESENRHTSKELWEATLSTFLAKFSFALTFLVPVLLLELWPAILASVGWGFLSLAALSFGIARSERKNPSKVIAEHLIIAAAVVLLAHYAGHWIAAAFG